MWSRVVVPTTLFVVAGVALGSACSGTEATSHGDPPDAGTATPPIDAAVDVTVRPDAEPPDPPRPDGVPNGWVLDRTYDKMCSFWVPTRREELPPPIRWEACPSTATPSGSACELMAIDWTPRDPSTPGAADSAWASEGGGLTLLIYRGVNYPADSAYRLVADADGPVHSALLIANYKRCSAAFGVGWGHRYVLGVYEGGVSGGGGGALIGRTDAVAPVAAYHVPALVPGHSVYATPFGVLSLIGETLTWRDWDTGADRGLFWSAAQDDNLQQRVFASSTNAMFWMANRLYRAKINVYTPELGVRPLLDPGEVSSPGYGTIGTDGKDLVWLKGEGHTAHPSKYDAVSIMTAPFTTKSEELAPRRLRSESGGVITEARPFSVACGHAVGNYDYHLRVTRVSDGVSWLLDGALTAPWRWMDQLGITCTHVYAKVNIGGTIRLARVRIDSLGPGIAPD